MIPVDGSKMTQEEKKKYVEQLIKASERKPKNIWGGITLKELNILRNTSDKR